MLLVGGPVLIACLMTPANAQRQRLDINVDLIQGDSVCGASYRLGDNRKLDFRINAESGFVDIAVRNLPEEVVNAGLDRDNVPITVIFNGDHRMTTDIGGFQAGFTYRAQGYWNDEDTGIEAIARLQNIETVSVEIDGESYGTATSEPGPDLGYNYIISCLELSEG
jgi:hypothetical protein